MAHTAPYMATWGDGVFNHTQRGHHVYIENLIKNVPFTTPIDPFATAMFPVTHERGGITRMNGAPGTQGATWSKQWLYRTQPLGSEAYLDPADEALLSQRINIGDMSFRCKQFTGAGETWAVVTTDITDGVYDFVLDAYAEQLWVQHQLNPSLTHYVEIHQEANIGDPVFNTGTLQPNPSTNGQPRMSHPWDPYGAAAFRYVVDHWRAWNGGALPMHDKILTVLTLTQGLFPGSGTGNDGNCVFFYESSQANLITGGHCDIVGVDGYSHADDPGGPKPFSMFDGAYEYASSIGLHMGIAEYATSAPLPTPTQEAALYASILPWGQAHSELCDWIVLTWGNSHEYDNNGPEKLNAIRTLVQDPFWGSLVGDTPADGFGFVL